MVTCGTENETVAESLACHGSNEIGADTRVFLSKHGSLSAAVVRWGVVGGFLTHTHTRSASPRVYR